MNIIQIKEKLASGDIRRAAEISTVSEHTIKAVLGGRRSHNTTHAKQGKKGLEALKAIIKGRESAAKKFK